MAELSFRQEIRISALEAAARVLPVPLPGDKVTVADIAAATIEIAEHFEEWIGWGNSNDDRNEGVR